MTSSKLSPIPLPEILVKPDDIRDLVESVESDSNTSEKIPRSTLKKIIECTDLTTLLSTDTRQKVELLAKKIIDLTHDEKSPLILGGLCIPGDLVEPAVKILKGSQTKIATVVNFPLGTSSLESVKTETRIRLEQGADEIDLVFPVSRYLSGEAHSNLIDFVLQIKNICIQHGAYLKTIIQSDELEDKEDPYNKNAIQRITEVAALSLAGGSDMIKTSTGKGSGGGASLLAGAIMCSVIKHFSEQTPYAKIIGHLPGIKFSGGVSNSQTADRFITLYKKVLRQERISPELFRFGASSLLGNVLQDLGLDRNYFAQEEAEGYG